MLIIETMRFSFHLIRIPNSRCKLVFIYFFLEFKHWRNTCEWRYCFTWPRTRWCEQHCQEQHKIAQVFMSLWYTAQVILMYWGTLLDYLLQKKQTQKHRFIASCYEPVRLYHMCIFPALFRHSGPSYLLHPPIIRWYHKNNI